MNKKIVSIFLAVLLAASSVCLTFAAEVQWPAVKTLDMPFAPVDNYISEQNSPSFTWPDAGTSYDLIVCGDYELTNILYKAEGLADNYYTFPHTLESGRELYWAVRFKSAGATSEWSAARKLIIDENAYVFTLPSTDELIERIPAKHPRMFVTPDTLAEVRKYKDSSEGSSEIFNHYKTKAEAYVADGEIPKEPVYEEADNYVETGIAMQKLRSDSAKVLDIIYTCGFVYLISGDKDIGSFAAKALVSVSGWDPYGDTSFAMQDQVCREITYMSAYGYDWCYDLLSESDKAIVENMISDRMAQMTKYITELKVSPYDSHGWTTTGYMGIVALAMYNDMSEAEGWLREILPLYANIIPPWSYEDGGWSQGTSYWGGGAFLKEYVDTMKLAGVYNLYDKAWQSNEFKNYLYSYPHGSVGSWGDQSSYSEMSPEQAYQIMKIATNNNNPYAKWFAEQTSKPYSVVNYFYMPEYEAVEEKAPYDMELSNYFKDIGWVSMNSNLVDENRISLFFKSSPYGSYNHSEADQNSFIIQAFGENLAIKAGYYDSYHSSHNSGFTRKTYAHNSVTVDGGKGQIDDNMDAKGKVTSFITSAEFDMCTGDASDAYSATRLEKFVRTVIYIRPDQFIVIDDLKVPESKKAGFEWWLNASDKISVYEDGNGAKIEKGNAVLDAKLHYPTGCTAYYSDLFSGPSLDHIAAQGSYANNPVHKRIWFETPRVNSTKMVVTMDAHRKEDAAKYVKTESFDSYMRLTFENGTVALINLLSDNGYVETKDGISFIGEAVVYNDEQIMLTNGTKLIINGKEIASAEKAMSLCFGGSELSVSSQEDNSISVDKANEYINGSPEFLNSDGQPFTTQTGITVSSSESSIAIDVLAGDYKLISENSLAGTKAGAASIEITIDGVTEAYGLDAYYLSDGSISATGEITVANGKYNIKEKSKNLNFGGVSAGASASINKVYVSTDSLEGNRIVLESVPSSVVVSEQLDSPFTLKDEMDAFVEAEYYDSLSTGHVYTTRAFLSGGAGVSEFNGAGNTAEYTVTVPEDGYYDVYIGYVSWEAGGESRRGFTLGGSYYITDLPYTVSWGTDQSEWRALKIPLSVYLSAGENYLGIEAISGMWNYDWIGLKKVK